MRSKLKNWKLQIVNCKLFALVLIFNLQFLICNSYAQNKKISKYIFPGYKILDTLSGDLNLDGRKDLLLILKVIAEDTMSFTEAQRPLLILIQNAGGSYYQAGRNNQVVLCKGCGGVFGDPYASITIKSGYFSIEHYGGSNWRWTDIATFHYDKKQKKWFLSRWGGDSFHTAEPEKKTTNIKTPKNFGVVEFEKFVR